MDVGNRAVGRQPSARIARRRAVAAQIHGEDVEPGRDERVHERSPFPGDLQVEIRQAAPGPPVKEQDRRPRLRGLLLPHRQMMAVRDDVMLDRLRRRRWRRRQTRAHYCSTEH